MAYYFFLGETLLPVAPKKLNTKIKNQNKTIELINESQVNILKDAGLTEISFEVLLPNVKYPFAVYHNGFKGASYYLDILEGLKTSKKPFQFIVTRKMPNGSILSYTNIRVSLEEYEIKESADDGFDSGVTIKLKQYRNYGAKTAVIKTGSSGNSAVSTNSNREAKDAAKTYTVKSGDTLWNIAKQEYGNATDWKKIYEENQSVIEGTSKNYGRTSSSNGHWIYPGTEIVLP